MIFESGIMEPLIGGLLGVAIAFVLIKIIDLTFDYGSETYLSLKERMEMDYKACQDFRDAGWSEQKIKDWMKEHDGFYDEGGEE